MPKFRKKPVVVEAHQWFKQGDHPEDKCHAVRGELISEGEVVRRFNSCDDTTATQCPECSAYFSQHGFIDTKEGGHRVCPGDWIITGVDGEYYPCKPSIFYATYEPVAEEAS